MKVYLGILFSAIFLPFTCQSSECPAFTSQEAFVSKVPSQVCAKGRLQFLLYDVQNGEGFNLRRDVYMRMVSVVYYLNNRHNLNVTLVLPSWGPLAHWKASRANTQLPWSTFFDVHSLSTIAPVLELHDFLSQHNFHIDLVLSLSYFSDSFDDESSLDDLKVKPFYPHYLINNECHQSLDGEYYLDESDKVSGWFWALEEAVVADELVCCHFEGTALTMAHLLYDKFVSYQSIVITDAQVVMHDHYGSRFFWNIRKSVKFSHLLIQLAEQFISSSIPASSTRNQALSPSAQKQSLFASESVRYLAVHLRRSDFLLYRKDSPSITCIAEQILTCITQNSVAMKYINGVSHVFVASDADAHEMKQLTSILEKAGISTLSYKSDSLSDGQIAIIHQIICSRASFFVGTFGSTFSFRIQEEREILAFPPDSTFNCFCPTCINAKSLCKQESQIRLVP